MRAHCGMNIHLATVPLTSVSGVRADVRDRVLTDALADVTLNSGLRRLNLHLPDEAEEIKKGRWKMVGYGAPSLCCAFC